MISDEALNDLDAMVVVFRNEIRLLREASVAQRESEFEVNSAKQKFELMIADMIAQDNANTIKVVDAEDAVIATKDRIVSAVAQL